MKRLFKFVLVFSLIFSLFGCHNNEPTVYDQAFDDLLLEWFKEDLRGDFVTAHYTIADLSKYDLQDIEVSLGKPITHDYEIYSSRHERLANYDTTKLNNQQLISYQTALAYYDNLKSMCQCDNDYDFAFTPYNGINNNLMVVFTEYIIRNKQDALDYITLLKDSLRYVDEALDYTLQQVERGICLSDIAIDGVIESCEKFLSHKEDNEVITSFNKQVEDLHLENSDELKRQCKQACYDYLFVAYQNIIDTFKNLYGNATVTGGLASYPGGKEYYEQVLRLSASSIKSANQILDMIKRAMEDYLYAYIDYMGLPDQDYCIDDPNATIELYKTKMAESFPELNDVNYQINYLDESLANNSTLAYYITSPIDDLANNVIKVNPKVKTSNDLGITLAHEGYPGHLYQHCWFNSSDNPNGEFRNNLDLLGYIEGWAMYIEDYAYHWLIEDQDYATKESLFNRFGYCLNAYADILINYKGYSVEQLAKEFENYYRESAALEVAKGMYDRCVSDPCLIISYACGVAQFDNLKAAAMEKQGRRFDEKNYHTQVLQIGATYFEIMEKYIVN